MARSFIGIGILVGLIGGAFVGINFGNLGPSLIIGMAVGWLAGWGVDRLNAASRSGRGDGSGGGYVSPLDSGHHGPGHGHGHHGDGGGHGGDSGGGDGGGD